MGRTSTAIVVLGSLLAARCGGGGPGAAAGDGGGDVQAETEAPDAAPTDAQGPDANPGGDEVVVSTAWPMPNPPSTGLPNPASYDTSVSGVVHDRVTGLDWQSVVDPSSL